MRSQVEGGADANGRGALSTALLKKEFVIAQFLLDHGAEVDARDGEALRKVTEQRSGLEAVKFLVKNKANVNVRRGEPLRNAVEAGSLSMVKFLVRSGADINISGQSPSITALNFSVRSIDKNHLKITEFLLKNGANPNFGSPLEHADPHLEMFRLLLDHGARPRPRSINIAVEKDNLDLVKLLIQHGAEVEWVEPGIRMSQRMRIFLYGAQDIMHRNIEDIFDIEGGDRKILKKIYSGARKYSRNFSFDSVMANESNLPPACFDLLMYSEEPIKEYLRETDNFLFVVGDVEGTVLCLDKNFLLQTVRNPYDNFFYECDLSKTGEDRFPSPVYVKIPLNKEGFVGLIPFYQILKVLEDNKKVYYITPARDEDGAQKTATYTASFRNSFSSRPNYVSGNHCQEGSNMLIFDVKICGGSRCKFS